MIIQNQKIAGAVDDERTAYTKKARPDIETTSLRSLSQPTVSSSTVAGDSMVNQTSGTTYRSCGIKQSLDDDEHGCFSEEVLSGMEADSSMSMGLDPTYSSVDLDVDITNATPNPQNAIAHSETRTVMRLRLLLMAFLIITTVAVALAVYFYTTRQEHNQFVESFDNHAAKVLDSIGANLDMTLGALDAYVVGLVTFANYAGMQWPYVTLPDHCVKLAKVRTLSKAMSIVQYHYVSDASERLRWENYTLENDEWVEQALAVQSKDMNYHGRLYFKANDINGVIHDSYGDRPYDEPGPFLPNWQAYPLDPNHAPYNWDGASYPQLRDALPELMHSHVAISDILNVPKDSHDPDQVHKASNNTDWAQGFLGPGESASEPFSGMFYPISNCAESQGIDGHFHSSNHGTSEQHCSLVGVLGVTTFWKEYFKDILSPGVEGIVLVMESTCNQTVTYQINGPSVTYLGSGDLHDSSFSHMERSSALHELGSFSTRDRDYTGAPVGSDTCSYTIQLYPSNETLSNHTSSNPIAFTVIAVLIFAFTSGIFLVYDFCVERRQRIIMYNSMKSNMIVALLEEKVRERTKKLVKSNERLNEANQRVMLASAQQLQHFASMSHEIRTPLNCIIGLASLMQENDLDAEQAESLQMIVTSGDLLLRVVNDVLDYSKLEADKVEVEVRQCQLQETLNAVVRAIETSGVSKRVSLESHYGASVCPVLHTDCRRLQQILYNLLGNAVKFSKEGGVVELHVFSCQIPLRGSEGDGAGAHPAQAGGPDNCLRFVIKDYGKGIAKRHHKRIFQPFLQASTSTERVYGGTGLGLAITAKLVKALGGSIRVDSKLGEWTEMIVEFPLNQEQTASADVPALSSRLRECTVLLVGDAFESNIAKTIDTLVHYTVQHQIFCDMQDLERACTSFDVGRVYVCLVHEDQYDANVYSRVKRQSKATVLLTFGHTFSVKDRGGHYRSLTQILPSLFVSKLGDYVEAALKQAMLKEAVQQRAMPSLGAHTSQNVREDGNELDGIAGVKLPYQDYRVLIAEDNLVNQKVLVRVLERLGINNVVVVDNGQKAVEQAASESFHVILMDMSMPVLDGVDACRMITDRHNHLMTSVKSHDADKQNIRPRIIFVTAHALDHFKGQCQEAGGNGFLSKPFRLHDVKECFEKLQTMIEDGNGMDSSFWCHSGS